VGGGGEGGGEAAAQDVCAPGRRKALSIVPDDSRLIPNGVKLLYAQLGHFGAHGCTPKQPRLFTVCPRVSHQVIHMLTTLQAVQGPRPPLTNPSLRMKPLSCSQMDPPEARDHGAPRLPRDAWGLLEAIKNAEDFREKQVLEAR
jgi:hypothetical protein